MAQDGNWTIPPDGSKEAELRGQVEGKLGKLDEHPRVRQAEAREAKLQRQYALEQAAGVVKATLDWHDDATPNAGEAGAATLKMADQFYRWVDTGQLPA